MALTDEVAQRVLGELYGLTKEIEGQGDRIVHTKQVLASVITALSDLDKRIDDSKNKMLATVEATKELHAAHIAELLAASAKQLEAVSAEKQDAFTKFAVSTAQAQIGGFVKDTEEAKKAILQSLADESVKIVRERVALEDSSLTQASNTYARLTKEFEEAMVKRHKDAREAVKKFDEALQKSIKDHAEVGWFGRLAGMTMAAGVGALLAGFLMARGIIPLPSPSLSEQDVHHQQLGANLENKFSRFTPKEQERINAVLTSH